VTEGRDAVTLTPMRLAIGRRMAQSKQSAPHFYVSADFDMTQVLEALAQRNASRPSESVTLTSYLLKGLATTLAAHPAFNSVWVDGQLFRVQAINIGVAIALADGLIAPALLDCAGQSVDQIAASLQDLTARARTGKLRAAEVNDATFTLSNLGMHRISSFTAIITPPQVAILATARTELRPVVIDGAVAIRPIMTATLSADHRAVDGAAGALFLTDLRAAFDSAPSWTSDR
jgi:pyruvate dehydrogenase E2 component (dihydrolipoamide acetyltransferase)